MRGGSRARAFSCAVTGVAILFSAAGCGESPTTTQEPSQDRTTVSAAPNESASSSSTPSRTTSELPEEESTSPSPTENETTEPASKRPDEPLSAEELPGFNAEFTWRVKSDRTSEPRRPFGTCHKFAMTSIGASAVAVRTYQPAPELSDSGATAGNLVATFPDPKTAKRAYEVLKSWTAQCADELSRHKPREVGMLQDVELPRGLSPDLSPARASGNWYLLMYGPVPGDPDAAYFDAQGLARVGSRVSVLEMRLIGQDYNYPFGQEPMVEAVQASAAKLAGVSQR